MSLLRSSWRNLRSLLVEDGALAMGVLAALAVTGIWIRAVSANAGLVNLGGPLLFGLLMLLLLGSLASAR